MVVRSWPKATLPLLLIAAAGPAVSAAPHVVDPAESNARCGPGLSLGLAGYPGLTITAADRRPAGVDKDRGPTPAHCELVGELEPRQGRDGQAYAIHFHLRLPAAWNGRMLFQGGGGPEGVLGDALGDLQGGQPGNALQLGYAVVSQDSGHDRRRNFVPDRGGESAFGWDPEARKDYAWRSQARVAALAKDLIGAYYGARPHHAYFVGCSKGGQEGVAVAQRAPEAFDGVLADAPGISFPRSVMAQAWDSQAFAAVARRLGARDPAGLPRLGASFSDADLGLVSRAVARACDGLDGLEDGIVGDFAACTTRRVWPALRAARCADAKTPSCLSADQLAALRSVFEGPRDVHGKALYSDWSWDLGIGGEIGGHNYPDWRRWKLGSAAGSENDALALRIGAEALASLMTTPPTPVGPDPESLVRYSLGFDFRRDPARLMRAPAPDGASAWAIYNGRGPLTGFRARGGRMMIVQGVSDPAFSVRDTARWIDGLQRVTGGRAADNVRLFAAPGMGHCRGGPATSMFDALTPLVRWVEQGRAPDRILAVAPPETPWPGRTRPLCAYPAVARYRGAGDVEAAESFVCRPGTRVSAL